MPDAPGRIRIEHLLDTATPSPEHHLPVGGTGVFKARLDRERYPKMVQLSDYAPLWHNLFLTN